MPWDDRWPSLLDLAEACDVPVGFGCRIGVCHNCESGLLAGDVAYDTAPLEPPADGRVLVCCTRPRVGADARPLDRSTDRRRLDPARPPELGERRVVAAAPPAARLWPLCAFLEAHSYPAAVKAACRLAGDSTGPVRAPLFELDAAATAELAPLVERAVGSARLSTAR